MNKYSCRNIGYSDLEMVMNWRMLPHVTQYMNTDPVLTLEGQIKWFEKLTKEEPFYYWIIEVNGIPCGVINIVNVDNVNSHATWGYYVAEKSLRSFELAVSLEMSLYDYVFDILKLNKISGETFCENTATIKIHEMCGCETEGIMKQHIYKNNKYYDVCIQSMFSEKWVSIRGGREYVNIRFM